MGLLERGFAYNVLLFCSRHRVQAMCTMFSRKDFFRLFGGLLRISTRKTNAEPKCLTSLDGHEDVGTRGRGDARTSELGDARGFGDVVNDI